MKRLGTLAYGIAIASVALIMARETIEPSMYVYQRLGNMAALGVAGWMIATLGPVALSIGVWLLARRLKARWMLHAMCVPMAIIIYNVGASLLFHAAGVPDGDSIEGYTLLAAAGFLLVILIAHATAFVAEGYRMFSARGHGS